MGADRKGGGILRLGRVISGLISTPDAELEAFRERRCPKTAAVSIEQLTRARDLLDAIAAAIDQCGATEWRRLDAAWRVVVEGADERRARAELELPNEPAVPGAAPAAEQPLLGCEVASSPWPRATPAVPAALVASDDLDGTGELNLRALGHAPLPFRGASAAPVSALRDLPPVAHDAVGLTSFGLKAIGNQAVLPFAPSQASRAAAARDAPTTTPSNSLTLEQFASLCAACAARPEATRESERRFGIATAQARAELDTHWKQRFEREPGLYEAFRRLYTQYQTWLVGQRGSGQR